MVATLVTTMKIWEVSPQTYLGTVKNDLLPSFDKDQPVQAPFEFRRSKEETDVLETEVEKHLKKGVKLPTKIQPDNYSLTYSSVKRKIVVKGSF